MAEKFGLGVVIATRALRFKLFFLSCVVKFKLSLLKLAFHAAWKVKQLASFVCL